jgi:DNA modification methylase
MKITIHNPAQLPVIDYRKIIPIQGDLKDLTETNYQKLKKSIEQNGFKIPAFVWKPAKNEEAIIDGAPFAITKGGLYNLDSHQRIRVLTKEDATPREIPYVLIHAENFQDAKKTLLLISSQYGTLTAEGFDTFAFDLDDKWIKEQLNFDTLDLNFGQQNVQEVKEDGTSVIPPKVPKTKTGDFYEINNHALVCGDARDKSAVEKVAYSKQVDILITDPPYNVDYVGKTKDSLKIDNDKQSDVKFREFLKGFYSVAIAYMKAGAPAYIFHADTEGANFRSEFKDAGFHLAQCLIWKKNTLVMGRQNYHWIHEPILYGWKLGASHTWLSDYKQTTVLEFDRPTRSEDHPTRSEDHPTMKPVKLYAYLLGNSCKKGGVALDTFAGSGTILIAAEQMGIQSRMIELDPRFCDVIIRRAYNYYKTNNLKFVIKRNGKLLKEDELSKF